MAAKILCHSLELELLYGFVSSLVQKNNPTLDVCWLVFCVIMIIKTYIFFTFEDFSWYFSFAHFGYYQNLVIWLYSSNFIFCVCSVALRKKSFFQQNSRWLTNHMLLKEATYPGHMLIRFWCDSDIIFSRRLHKNLVTVLYFSIIKVLCGAGGDASFAPQANLVLPCFMTNRKISCLFLNLLFFYMKCHILK